MIDNYIAVAILATMALIASFFIKSNSNKQHKHI